MQPIASAAGFAFGPFGLEERVAAGSVAASLILAIAKFAAGYASGSLALLSEGRT
jgi:divalent metal cation (Fe/Co/Zn/Cd) transporter